MFARRRARRDDDEPLVPHGLVWQATDKPPSEPEPSGEQAHATRPQARPDGVRPKPPLPAVSVEPRPTAARPFLVRFQSTPEWRPPASPVPRPLPEQSSSEKFAGFAGLRTAAVRLVRFLRSQGLVVRAATMRYSVVAARSCERLGSTIGRTVRNGAVSFQSEEFKAKLRTVIRREEWTMRAAFDRAASYARDFLTRTSPVLQARWTEIQSWYRRSLTRRVRIRIQFPAFGDGWDAEAARSRFRDLGPRSRILLARARTQWALKRFEKDSRVWMSMTLGALCALAALGFVSTVRHFATRALPSNQILRERGPARVTTRQLDTEHPKATSQPAELSKSKAASPREESLGVEQVSERKPVPVQKPRSRAQRNEEDDYVAKDTYVYYGTEGAPSQ